MHHSIVRRLLLTLVAVGLCASASVQAKKLKPTDVSAMAAAVVDAYVSADCSKLAKGKGALKPKDFDAIRLYFIQNPADIGQFLAEAMPGTTARMTECGLL